MTRLIFKPAFAALLFVLGMLVGACSAPQNVAPRAPTRTEQAADLESKTIALVMHDRVGRARSYCSGTWVSETSILTAFHCLGDEGEPVEYVVRGDVYAPGELHERAGGVVARTATVYATDEGHDLALLRGFYAPPHGVAHVELDGIRAGAFVQTMGHPLGLWWSYSSGDVASVRQHKIDLDILWIQATPPISPGNSGCGLFDARGALVGVAHGGFPRGSALSFFVHGQYVADLLRKQGAAL